MPKPTDTEIALRIIRVLHPRVVLHPIDATAHTIPESIGVLDGLGVHLVVLSPLDEGASRKRLGNRISIMIHRNPLVGGPGPGR